MSGATDPAIDVKRAALITHTHPDMTSEAVSTAIRIAAESGAELVASVDEHAKHLKTLDGVAEAPLTERPDVCLALGGDGTILFALRRFAGTGVPVFGINFGTVGFLAAAEREDLKAGLRRAFSGEFDVMSLPALEVPGLDNAGPDPLRGLNDVSFSRRPRSRVAELSCHIGDDAIGHVRCDGLVAATPAGSTGYNLANQGPILAWGVKGYVVSFIAPHTLTARALVVAPGDELRVGNAPGREPVDIEIDGELVGELEGGSVISVRFKDAVGSLAQTPGSSFYRRIREKFGALAE